MVLQLKIFCPQDVAIPNDDDDDDDDDDSLDEDDNNGVEATFTRIGGSITSTIQMS